VRAEGPSWKRGSLEAPSAGMAPQAVRSGFPQ